MQPNSEFTARGALVSNGSLLARIVSAWASLALLTFSASLATSALLAQTPNLPDAAPAATSTPAENALQPVRYEWRFRSSKAMEDGAFTANAWKVGQLTELVFRRNDHRGADRLTFLKSLPGKFLKIQYADTTMVRVKVTASEERGDQVALACGRLPGAQDEWHWNINEIYTVQTDDPTGEPLPPTTAPSNVPVVASKPAPPVNPVTPTPAAPAPLTPAPPAAKTSTEQKTEPYSWRFRSFENLKDGAFSTNAWRMGELDKFVFRRLDDQGEDRSAFLLGLAGKTLVIRDGKTVVVRAKITSVKDDGNQVFYDCQRLSDSGGEWRYNGVYTIQVEDDGAAGKVPAAVAAGKPAAAAENSPPLAERKADRYFWRFRSFETMRDGTFTANTWNVRDLKGLVFRRLDDIGEDRSAFLMGLQGKTLTIRQGELTVAIVKTSKMNTDGKHVSFDCEKLSGASTSWQSNTLYSIEVEDAGDAARPAGSGVN